MKSNIKRKCALVLAFVMLVTTAFSLDFGSAAVLGTKGAFAFDGIAELREKFKAYYTPTDANIEATDPDGIPLYKECDPSQIFSVTGGVLKRYGTGAYAGGSGRKGAGSLYLKDFYENFEIEYDYCIAGTTGYRWAGVGFGASKIGGHFVNDGYFTYVEKEGTVRLFNNSTSAPAIQSTKYTDFQTYCTTLNNWVHLKVRVQDRKLTVTHTYGGKNITCEKTLSDSYRGGYVYLNSYTQNMQFKNLTVKRLQSYTTPYTTAYTFDDIAAVGENFTGYAFSNTDKFGAKDENGNSLINEDDISKYWRINAENSALERYGTGEYAGGRATNGAALLYFDKQYEDFEFTAKYRFSNAAVNGSYKWMGFGFGAENMGDCYNKDSYFAVVEQEGRIRLHLKRTPEQDPLARYSGTNDLYTEQVKTNLDTSMWHTITVRVVESYCYISYDGNDEYRVSIAQDTTGYAYLFANTQYLQIKDVKMTRYLYGDNVHTIEVWPEETETESFVSSGVSDISRGEKEFSFKTTVNGAKTPISVTFPVGGGIRIKGKRGGFFESSKYKNITYTEDGGGLLITAGEQSVRFVSSGTAWRLITVKDSKESVALSSENLVFGYKDGKLSRIKYSFPINSGEKFYGLGERYNAVNQNGYTVTLWNHDATYHAEGSSGDKTDSYANVPMLHSTDGYAVFFNSTYAAEADIGYTYTDIFSFDFKGDILDLYIFSETPEENMQSYTDITGKPFVPPKWAFGYWMGSARGLYDTAVTDAKEALTDGTEFTFQMEKEAVNNKVKEVIEGYKQMGTMPYAMYGEGLFIDHADVTVPTVKSYGLKGLLWHSGHTSYSNAYSLLDCSPLDLPIVKSGSNSLKYFGNPSRVYIDFTNPLALTLVKAQLKRRAAYGMRGYMVDMGEYLAEDTLYYNGKTGDEMHNLHSYYYAKVQNEAMKDLVGDDFVLFERSGCAGSWQYATKFGGDQKAAWYGLKQQLNGLITASASGFSVYGADIGGLSGRPSDELYMRWVQFSAFTPLMREHGTTNDGLPWTYSAAAKQNFIDYYHTRNALIDHIYSAALKSGKTGVPMTQSLSFAYPDDGNVRSVEDQYIFCDTMLVAPIVEQNTVLKKITLPSGTWYNLWNGEKESGGKNIYKLVSSDTLPVYLKSGSVTPLSLSEKLSLKESGERKTLLITAPETDTKSSLLTDNGEYNFELNKKSDTAITLKKSAADGYNTVILYGFKATSVTADGDEVYDFYTDGDKTVVTFKSGAETVNFYSKGVLKKGSTTEIFPENDSDLDGFVTYSVKGDQLVEQTDSDGNTLNKKVNSTDIWRVPYKGVIMRDSKPEYKSATSRHGASSLYFEGEYTDFELEFSYNYNGARSSWRWVAAGFGAETVGDSYYDSGYLALLEQEGTLKILDGADAIRLKNDKEDGYPDTYPDLDAWYTFKLRVKGNTATMWFDGVPYTTTLSDYSGGRIYLHCFTDGMMFKDIKITDLTGTAATEFDRFEIRKSKISAFGEIKFAVKSAFAGEKVIFEVKPHDGFLSGGAQVYGFDGEGIVFVETVTEADGRYAFTMPDYPVTVSADCYLLCDANADGSADILDLIRIKKYLADNRALIHTLATDVTGDKNITADDLAAIKKALIKN